jgi:hypothetical protein
MSASSSDVRLRTRNPSRETEVDGTVIMHVDGMGDEEKSLNHLDSSPFCTGTGEHAGRGWQSNASGTRANKYFGLGASDRA